MMSCAALNAALMPLRTNLYSLMEASMWLDWWLVLLCFCDSDVCITLNYKSTTSGAEQTFRSRRLL